MGQLLDALRNLQHLERKLAGFRREEASRDRRLKAAQRQVDRVQTKLEDLQRDLRERQMRLDSLNLEVATRDETVQKHRQALTKARTNKEYAAILTAINTSKADTSKLETAALELMDETQSLKDTSAKLEEEKQQYQERVAHAQQELADYQAKVADDRNRLQLEREQCAEDIAPTTLNLFTRVAEHHDGEAMVPVKKLNPKREEYACGGCNMMITLEVVNLLQARDDIQCCHVCGRILYLDEQMRPTTRL